MNYDHGEKIFNAGEIIVIETGLYEERGVFLVVEAIKKFNFDELMNLATNALLRQLPTKVSDFNWTHNYYDLTHDELIEFAINEGYIKKIECDICYIGDRCAESSFYKKNSKSI